MPWFGQWSVNLCIWWNKYALPWIRIVKMVHKLSYFVEMHTIKRDHNLCLWFLWIVTMASMEMESEYSMEVAVESTEFHGNLRDGIRAQHPCRNKFVYKNDETNCDIHVHVYFLFWDSKVLLIEDSFSDRAWYVLNLLSRQYKIRFVAISGAHNQAVSKLNARRGWKLLFWLAIFNGLRESRTAQWLHIDYK